LLSFASCADLSFLIRRLSNPVFLTRAKTAKKITIKPSDSVIDFTVKPVEDNPKNKPEIPAMLKLKATDKTAFSIRSSLPSLKRKLTRQYPGTKATNVNPKKNVSPDRVEPAGIL